jgi:hypothetical protein
MNTPTLKTAIFAAETVAHLHGFEQEILPLTDLAREMDAEIGRLRKALAIAAESMRPPTRGALKGYVSPELAAIRDALQKPETPQSARPRKCLDDNSKLHD